MNESKMVTSRLVRSSNASLRDLPAIKRYCQKNNLPCSQDFFDVVLPDPKTREYFLSAYTLNPPFPPLGLKHSGASTILVFETRTAPNSNHGEVVASVAHQVGHSLDPKVDTLYIQASLNPKYLEAFEKDKAQAIATLIEEQGAPVLHTSIGWNDLYLDFDKGYEEQAARLWRVTSFLVDSAGNDGKFGEDGKQKPFQKHNALTHYAPLVVHVGAAAIDTKGQWNIEGYSAANSPTFLAPVASRTFVKWKKDANIGPLTGTSAAAPYASGVLAALNHRYGAYLTREQILYAVMATCTPIKHVTAFEKKTPKDLDIEYKKNSAGLSYNPEYGGFGLIHNYKADKLLSHMVAMTQEKPESITIPTEERVTVNNPDGGGKPDADGKYRYTVHMPAGFALKTSVEVEFGKKRGDVTITSPSDTTLPMVLSKHPLHGSTFGMSTGHGWAGESLEGDWVITSTQPIKRMRMSQHHFLEHDIIHDLDIPALLATPAPQLGGAIPLSKLHAHTQRILHTAVVPQTAMPQGLKIGAEGKEPELEDVSATIAQLKALPSGFANRNRQKFMPAMMLDAESAAGKLETDAYSLVKNIGSYLSDDDAMRHQIAELQMAAAREYEKANEPMKAIIPLCNAGYNYLACQNLRDTEGHINAEKAISVYRHALRLAHDAELNHKSYEIGCNLYTALCRCCEHGKEAEYGKMLEGLRHEAFRSSRLQQGPVDEKAHRIEEGEFGFSDHDRIGTDNVSQCIAIIAQNPVTLKTGIAHIDNENDVESLKNFFSKFGEGRLKIRLVGARFDQDYRTNENISNVMKYLSKVDADIISSDIYEGNDGPSTVVVDPTTFTLEEKVPGRHSENEAISNAIMLFTRKGKPLVEQFDFSEGRDHIRNPVHLNARMLTELRAHYLGKKEWSVEGYLGSQAVYDRPLLVSHVYGLEDAYNEQWEKLSGAMEKAIADHRVSGADAERAREALLAQSLYVGSHADQANAPIMEWINHRLFEEERVRITELEGPARNTNIYDPAGPPQPDGHIGAQMLRALNDLGGKQF